MEISVNIVLIVYSNCVYLMYFLEHVNKVMVLFSSAVFNTRHAVFLSLNTLSSLPGLLSVFFRVFLKTLQCFIVSTLVGLLISTV